MKINKIDPKSILSINDQIKALVTYAIDQGVLGSGDELPTVTKMAAYQQVNHNTIAAAYSDLIDTGLLKAQRGKGTFVDTEINLSRELISNLSDLIAEAKREGISANTLLMAVFGEYTEQSKEPKQAVLVVLKDFDINLPDKLSPAWGRVVFHNSLDYFMERDVLPEIEYIITDQQCEKDIRTSLSLKNLDIKVAVMDSKPDYFGIISVLS